MAVNIPHEVNVIKSFRRRKTITWFMWIIGAVFWAGWVSSLRNPDVVLFGFPKDVETWGMFAIGLIIFIISFFVWRCPVCRSFLGITTRISACKKCHTVFEASR